MMVLNNYLKGKYYLVGNNVTIADIAMATHLSIPFQTIFDGGYRKAIPEVAEWFERITSLPSFVRVCGYIKMSEKAFKQWDPNAKVEPIKAAAPAGGKKGAKGGKKEEPKKEEKADDDFDDLFGDDDEADAEAAKKAAAAAKAGAKKKKKEVIAMSLVLLEVKPLDSETNLDQLAQDIFKNIT